MYIFIMLYTLYTVVYNVIIGHSGPLYETRKMCCSLAPLIPYKGRFGTNMPLYGIMGANHLHCVSQHDVLCVTGCVAFFNFI